MSRGYCLKWNKYNTIFQSSFGSLLTSEELTDVTFVCEGQFINCHRLVIAAASQYFKDIFVRLTQPNPVVVLNDVKYTVFKALIDFIYCGEIQVQKDLLEAVVKAGEKFHVRGLNEADESNTCGTSTEDRHNEVEFNQESHTKRRKIDDPVVLQKTSTHLEDTRLDSALTRSIPRPSQPVSVNTVQVYTHASNLKKELCENASSNEDSFLREAESADFDYAEAEIDEENEQGEYQFEQSDFALNADGDDQEELLKFGLEAEPQCGGRSGTAVATYFSKSNRRYSLALVDGFIFIREKVAGGRLYWRCKASRSQGLCKVRGKTREDGSCFTLNFAEHNHYPPNRSELIGWKSSRLLMC